MRLFKKKDKSLGGTHVNVVIKKSLANSIYQTVSSFIAAQERDSSDNLVLVNEDKSFKEDANFEKEQVIEHLKYKLNSYDLNREQQIKEIKEKIQKQQEKLSLISDGYLFKSKDDLNKYNSISTEKQKIEFAKNNAMEINPVDTENWLRVYKVLLYDVEHDKRGSYEEINQNGERVISFLSRDGFLYPFFHSVPDPDATIHPDMASKKKLYKEANQEVLNDYLESQQGLFSGWIGKALQVLALIFIVVNIVWSINIADRERDLTKFTDESYMQELTDMASGNAIRCSYYYAELMNDNGELLTFLRNTLMNVSSEKLEELEIDKEQKKALTPQEIASKLINLG